MGWWSTSCNEAYWWRHLQNRRNWAIRLTVLRAHKSRKFLGQRAFQFVRLFASKYLFMESRDCHHDTYTQKKHTYKHTYTSQAGPRAPAGSRQWEIYMHTIYMYTARRSIVAYLISGSKAWKLGEAGSPRAYDDSFIKVGSTANFVLSCIKEVQMLPE